MKRYDVIVEQRFSTTLEIEAESKEEAIQKAKAENINVLDYDQEGGDTAYIIHDEEEEITSI